MFIKIKNWWKTLGYAYPRGDTPGQKIWGLRPFGKRWFWFVIDDLDNAKPVNKAKDSND